MSGQIEAKITPVFEGGGCDDAIASCDWRGADGAKDATLILAFLRKVGIRMAIGSVSESVLPGMTAQNGMIIVDPSIPVWPGDLLHEAGHIAMTDPEVRETCKYVSDCPGEEMGAIAWSVAAAHEIGFALDVVFHDDGYRGSSKAHAENFSEGRTFGVPMLALYGLSAEPHRAAEQGIKPYPVMQRWLR